MRAVWLSGIFLWFVLVSIANAGSWSAGSPLQTGRAGLEAAVLGGKIYAIGGAGVLSPLGNTETYQAGRGGWRVDADLPVGLESFGMTAYKGNIFAAGGYAADTNGNPTARMWEFDPVSDDWVQGPSMPSARANFALVGAEGKLFAIGGIGVDASKIYVYNLQDRQWSTLEQGLRNSRDLAAIAIEDKIYVVGGGPVASPVAAVHILDTTDLSWTEGPAMPVARSGHAMAAMGNKIHVFGGRGSGRGASLADHWVLDITDGTWKQAESLPTPRTGAAAATLGKAIYLIGGGAGGGFFAPFTAIAETDVWRPATED